MITPIRFHDDSLELLDQRLLPGEETWIRYEDENAVAVAIREMVVRGAPAIGITAAYGLALSARRARALEPEGFAEALVEAGRTLEAARPTAVNLTWAVGRMLDVARDALDDGLEVPEIVQGLRDEAVAIHEEDIAMNREIGSHGSMLVPDGARILTHCNAGALATGAYGTALGVIRAAVEDGKKVTVFADETRPYLQGARLTAWELLKDKIPVTVITDNMAGHLMARGEIDLVVVGSDRIAMNGDIANKIGTYTVAVLARRHGVPFYVAAPVSTIDADCPSGEEIPIEERDPSEVLEAMGVPSAPEGASARHPAFDVTPAELVTAIVTNEGLARAPFTSSLRKALGIEEEQDGKQDGEQDDEHPEGEMAIEDVDDPAGERESALEIASESGAEFAPESALESASGPSPEFSLESSPQSSPESGLELVPERDSEAAPESASEFSPESGLELVPERDSEAAPKSASELSPES